MHTLQIRNNNYIQAHLGIDLISFFGIIYISKKNAKLMNKNPNNFSRSVRNIGVAPLLIFQFEFLECQDKS